MQTLMRTIVIASGVHRPGVLQSLEAAPCDVMHPDQATIASPADALMQDLGQALARLTDDTLHDGGLLVVELSAGRSPAELDAIESWLLRHPAWDVLALIASEQADLPAEVLHQAMRAGVRELIAWPAPQDTLVDAVQCIWQRQHARRVHRPDEAMGVQASLHTGTAAEHTMGFRAGHHAGAAPGRVAVFLSASGGRSATVLACNVAALLAAEHQRRTLYIDLDLPFADASYLLGEHHASAHTQQLARDIGRLDGQLLQASVSRVAPQFDLLAAPGDALASPALADLDLTPLMATARQTHECVVLEVDRRLDATARQVLQQASLVFLVTDALLPFLRDTRRIAQSLADLGISEPRLRMVLNRFDRAGDLTPREVESATGLRIAHTLPAREDELRDSLNAGLMLSLWRPGSPWVRALRPMAEEIAGSAAPRSTDWLGRLLGRRASAPASPPSHTVHASPPGLIQAVRP